MPERGMPFEPLKDYVPLEEERGGGVALEEQEVSAKKQREKKYGAMIAALEDVAREKNPHVIQEMVRYIAANAPRGTLELGDLAAIEQETASREELRDAVFATLEREGVLSHGPEREVIVNVEQLRTWRRKGPWKYFANSFYRTPGFATYLADGGGSLALLLYAFEGVSVIVREDWERGEREGQSLFYSPASFAEATDPEAIRESRFHLGIHEVISNVKHNLRYPTGRDAFTLAEATIPLLIYHPKYGDGSRNTAGRLMVRSRDGSLHPITSRWFTKEMHYTGGSMGKHASLDTPRRYVEEQVPRLLERHVIRREDFEAMTVGSTAEHMGIRTAVGVNGFVTIEGIRYFLGRQFDAKRRAAMASEPVVYKLSPTIGGVVSVDAEGHERLTHVFDLTTSDDQRLKKRSAGSKTFGKGYYFDAPRAVTNCRPYHSEEFHRQRPDETADAYRERTHTLDQFEVLLRLQRYLKKETGINLHQLSLQEQQWLGALVAKEKKYFERIGAFAARYGLSGLRTFLSKAHDSAMGERIFSIGDTLEHDIASDVFQKYGEIIDAVADARTTLDHSFVREQSDMEKKAILERIHEQLLKRGRDFLATIAERVEKKGAGKLEGQEIMQALERFRTDVLLFATTFRSALKEYPALTLDAMRDITIHTDNATALSNTDRTAMRRIFRENRHGKYSAELLRVVQEDFDKALSADGNEFHLLKHGNELISFFRFEQLPNGHVYLGSWNVRQEAQGSQLGNAMLGAALERMNAPMEAVVYEKNTASLHVLEKFGFRVVGRDDDYLGTGEAFFKLERPARKAEKRVMAGSEASVAT